MQNKIEGIHAVFEAIDAHVPIEQIYVGNYVKNKKIKGKIVDKQFLDKLSDTGRHQGVIAIAKPFKYGELKLDNDPSLIVILDHIQDSGNLGAIIRSAEAVGADAVVIPNKRAAQVTPTTYKTSAGAIFNIPVVQVANIPSTIDKLKNNGYWIAAASEHTDKFIWNENLKGKIGLVMGSEHDGVSQLVLKKSDFKVKLPIPGKVESLNVAQAATACMYEWLRQNA